MVHAANSGLTASPELIAEIAPPAAEPSGFFAWARNTLRLCRQVFGEAQHLRRMASRRHPFFDS